MSRLFTVHLPRPNNATPTITIDLDSRPLPGNARQEFWVVLIRLIQPRVVIELGSFDGVMTSILAEALPSDGILYSFDLNTEWAEPLIRAWGLQDRVRFIKGDFINEVCHLSDGVVGFANLDGDHSKESTRQAVERVWPKMIPGGVIGFDCVNGYAGGDSVREFLPEQFPHEGIYFSYSQGLAIVQKPPVYIQPLGLPGDPKTGQPILWRGA